LDLQLIEFDREMHDFQRDLFKISSGVNQISRFTQQLGQKEDSHDLRAKLNANIEITKDNIQHLNDKLQAIIPKRSSIPVIKLITTFII
jgi:predicted  nucleic acid-binding Zn-ribbon protein